MNVINGGAHADNALDFQELMIIPEGASSCTEAIRMGAEVFHALKKILKKAGYATSVGDEGGYAPNVQSNAEALQMILEAIAATGYTTEQIKIGLDVASTEFYRDGKYYFEGKELTSAQLVDYYLDLINNFPIVSIEDGFAEDDFAGRALCQKTFEEKGLAHIGVSQAGGTPRRRGKRCGIPTDRRQCPAAPAARPRALPNPPPAEAGRAPLAERQS